MKYKVFIAINIKSKFSQLENNFEVEKKKSSYSN